MSIAIGEPSRTLVAGMRAGATVVWLLALLATLPWLAALQHLGTLPAEAARQELADGQPWPGLLAARIVGGIAIGVAVMGAWLIARRAPHLVAGVLVALAVVMGGVVRPLAWRHAPVDVFLIERGKSWAVWLALSVLGMGLVAGAGVLVRRSARLRAPNPRMQPTGRPGLGSRPGYEQPPRS
jgi:hypothetical protein